jgi:CRP/FNR family cyclic AMP-dependent transcriptional regulator
LLQAILYEWLAMQPRETNSGYKIWAVDGVVYGPVELKTLVEWAKDERVISDTWVYCEASDSWQKASELKELQAHLAQTPPPAPQPIMELKVGSLRRVKVLADLSDQQLERFAQFMEVQKIRPFQEVVRQGESGIAMYMVLEGELRARLMIQGKEAILATLGAGDFFGEMSLIDSGPRSADVVSNTASVLLKVSKVNFGRLLAKAPELAAPFLLSVSKTLAARIRADNKRLKDSFQVARATGL